MRISQNKYPFDWFLPIRSYIGGKSISFWVPQNWINAVLTLTLHAIQFTTRAQFRWNLSVFNKPFEEKYWIGSFFNIITKSIPESYLSSKAPFTLWKQQLKFCQHWFGWEFLKIQTQKTYWFCIDFFEKGNWIQIPRKSRFFIYSKRKLENMAFDRGRQFPNKFGFVLKMEITSLQ